MLFASLAHLQNFNSISLIASLMKWCLIAAILQLFFKYGCDWAILQRVREGGHRPISMVGLTTSALKIFGKPFCLELI
jgi:hypothetical protein